MVVKEDACPTATGVMSISDAEDALTVTGGKVTTVSLIVVRITTDVTAALALVDTVEGRVLTASM